MRFWRGSELGLEGSELFQKSEDTLSAAIQILSESSDLSLRIKVFLFFGC